MACHDIAGYKSKHCCVNSFAIFYIKSKYHFTVTNIVPVCRVKSICTCKLSVSGIYANSILCYIEVTCLVSCNCVSNFYSVYFYCKSSRINCYCTCSCFIYLTSVCELNCIVCKFVASLTFKFNSLNNCFACYVSNCNLFILNAFYFNCYVCTNYACSCGSVILNATNCKCCSINRYCCTCFAVLFNCVEFNTVAYILKCNCTYRSRCCVNNLDAVCIYPETVFDRIVIGKNKRINRKVTACISECKTGLFNSYCTIFCNCNTPCVVDKVNCILNINNCCCSTKRTNLCCFSAATNHDICITIKLHHNCGVCEIVVL